MLFLVSGSFILFAMIQLGVFDRQATMNEVNVEYVLAAQSRNVANSGLERAINRISTDFSWRTGLDAPVSYNFGSGTASVTVVDGTFTGVSLPFGFIEIRSSGNSNGVTSVAVARIRVENGLPQVHGTMGIFTDNLSFNVSGSSFLITGHDTNPDGTAGLLESLPGIAVNSQAAFDEIYNSLNNTQRGRIQGEETPDDLFDTIGGLLGANKPSLTIDPSMDGDALEDFVQLAISNADVIYDDHVASGEGSLGTVEAPQVVIVNGTLEVRNATGAGIIIIKEGGSLDARGNFDKFEGLIIVQGNADLTRGNINIMGAMLFGGSNPSVEIDIDFRGNVNIQYSSHVLNNLSTRLPQTAGMKQELVSIFD
ncbi:MAG: hypothetical protein LAT57_03215 [Balneolales bacterium]|nr:hypothetical protein [Balneolales bacterium]